MYPGEIAWNNATPMVNATTGQLGGNGSDTWGCSGMGGGMGGAGGPVPLSSWLLLVGLPLIIVVGSVGNVLSIVVLRRRVMQMSAASFYLIVLAFSDLSILYFSALKTWIRMVFGFELLHTSDVACKLLKYIFFTSSHLSSWLVVAITVERLVVVRFPFKASRFCSYRQSVRITCVICAVIMLLNVNVLGASKLVQAGCKPMCVTYLYSPHHYSTYNLSVYSLIPFVLVLSMNLMTILSIVKNNKLFRQQQQQQQPVRGSDAVHTQISSITPRPPAPQPPAPPAASSSHSSSSKDAAGAAGGAEVSGKDSSGASSSSKRSPVGGGAGLGNGGAGVRVRGGGRHLVQQQRRLTCTLLTITVLWLVLTGPYAILDLLELQRRHMPTLLRVITWLLMYSNHSVNFYIYCLTGRKFRSELRRAFCPRDWKPAAYRKVPFQHSIPPPQPRPTPPVPPPTAPRHKLPSPGHTAPAATAIAQATNSANAADTYNNGHCKTTKL
jgi:hypothetical protein